MYIYLYISIMQIQGMYLYHSNIKATKYKQSVSWNSVFLCIFTYQSLNIECSDFSDNEFPVLFW